MTTDRRRGPETRWYEPPPRREWHPNSTELKRLEATSHLRKSFLEPTASRAHPGTILKRNSRVDLEKVALEKGLLPQSLRGSTSSLSSMARGPLGQSLGRARKDYEKDVLASMPNLSRQPTSSRSGSESDFGNTFVLKNKFKSQSDVGKVANKTSPSRPRSSSLTKYDPLPKIRHSAPTQEVRDKDELDAPRGGTATLRKGPISPWAELSQPQRRSERPKEATRSPWTVPSSPMESSDTNNNRGTGDPPPMIRSRTFDVFDTKLKNLPVVESDSEGDAASGPYDPNSRIVTVNIEGKPLKEFLTHARDGLLMSRPGTRYGRNEPSKAATSTSSRQTQEQEAEKGDILVYIKLPDDSLLLTSSPPSRTLGQLLEVVAATHVGGHKLLIADDGLDDDDLDKTLPELGITDNTTLHLMFYIE